MERIMNFIHWPHVHKSKSPLYFINKELPMETRLDTRKCNSRGSLLLIKEEQGLRAAFWGCTFEKHFYSRYKLYDTV